MTDLARQGDTDPSANEVVLVDQNVRSTYAPWPVYWTWPAYTVSSQEEGYANEVEVERGEHDATLRFYRKRGEGRSLVKEVTVPLSLLEWLRGS